MADPVQAYIRRIRIHANRSTYDTLYPGQLYKDLSQFFTATEMVSSALAANESRDGKEHGILYTYHKSGGRRVKRLKGPADWVQTMQNESGEQQSRLLFLRGHSSPEWLSVVASFCDIDPEFLNSNMLFRCRRTFSAYPALPSAYEDIIRLKVITIGWRGFSERSRDADSIPTQRAELKRHMERYQHELMVGTGVQLSDSIIRDHYVLDKRNFILEQEISICLNFDENKSWTGKT